MHIAHLRFMPEKKTSNKRFFLIFWLCVIVPVGLMALFITGIGAGVFSSLPSFEELENPRSNLASEIFTADHQVLGKYYYQNRSNVAYKNLSPNLVHALKATED